MEFTDYQGKDAVELTNQESKLVLLDDSARSTTPLPPPEPQNLEEVEEDLDWSLKDMTQEEFEAFLDKEFPDYPKDTPEAFKKIGAENWWW